MDLDKILNKSLFVGNSVNNIRRLGGDWTRRMSKSISITMSSDEEFLLLSPYVQGPSSVLTSVIIKFFKKEREKKICLMMISFSVSAFFLLPLGEFGDWRPDMQWRTQPQSTHKRNIHIFSNTCGFLHPWKQKRVILKAHWELALEYQAFSLFLLHPLECVDLALPLS